MLHASTVMHACASFSAVCEAVPYPEVVPFPKRGQIEFSRSLKSSFTIGLGAARLNRLRKNEPARQIVATAAKSPPLIRNGFRGPEGPLFHGAARIHF